MCWATQSRLYYTYSNALWQDCSSIRTYINNASATHDDACFTSGYTTALPMSMVVCGCVTAMSAQRHMTPVTQICCISTVKHVIHTWTYEQFATRSQPDINQPTSNIRRTTMKYDTHPLPLNYVFNWDTHTHMHTHQYNAHVLVTSTANVAKYINFSLLHVTEFLRNNVTSAISHEMSLTYISAHQQTPIPPPRPAVLSHSISELKIDQPILTRCCSYAVGRTTSWHPATSSRIFFPLHLFSPRSCHIVYLSTAEHRLSMLFFFSHENIFLLSCLQL